MPATMRVFVRTGHLPPELLHKTEKGKPFRGPLGLTLKKDEIGWFFDWQPYHKVRGNTGFTNPERAFWKTTIHDRWTPVAHRTTGMYGDPVSEEEIEAVSNLMNARAYLDLVGGEYLLEVWGPDAEAVRALWLAIRTGSAKVLPSANFEAEQN